MGKKCGGGDIRERSLNEARSHVQDKIAVKVHRNAVLSCLKLLPHSIDTFVPREDFLETNDEVRFALLSEALLPDHLPSDVDVVEVKYLFKLIQTSNTNREIYEGVVKALVLFEDVKVKQKTLSSLQRSIISRLSSDSQESIATVEELCISRDTAKEEFVRAVDALRTCCETHNIHEGAEKRLSFMLGEKKKEEEEEEEEKRQETFNNPHGVRVCPLMKKVIEVDRVRMEVMNDHRDKILAAKLRVERARDKRLLWEINEGNQPSPMGMMIRSERIGDVLEADVMLSLTNLTRLCGEWEEKVKETVKNHPFPLKEIKLEMNRRREYVTNNTSIARSLFVSLKKWTDLRNEMDSFKADEGVLDLKEEAQKLEDMQYDVCCFRCR